MTLAGIGTVVLASVPEELTLRTPLLTPTVGIGLFIAFVLVSLAKLIKSDVFSALVISNVKVSGVYAFVRESYPLNKGGSILLLVNYLLSFSLVLYIASQFSLVKFNGELLLVTLIPPALLLWSVGSMIVIGAITGERQVFSEPLMMKLVGTQLLGLIYFVVALVLSLHPMGEVVFLTIIFWVFIAETIVRLYKSIRIVYSRGVSWYYIILYFCTLEILPLFIAYYLLLRDFVR